MATGDDGEVLVRACLRLVVEAKVYTLADEATCRLCQWQVWEHEVRPERCPWPLVSKESDGR